MGEKEKGSPARDPRKNERYSTQGNSSTKRHADSVSKDFKHVTSEEDYREYHRQLQEIYREYPLSYSDAEAKRRELIESLEL